MKMPKEEVEIKFEPKKFWFKKKFYSSEKYQTMLEWLVLIGWCLAILFAKWLFF